MISVSVVSGRKSSWNRLPSSVCMANVTLETEKGRKEFKTKDLNVPKNSQLSDWWGPGLDREDPVIKEQYAFINMTFHSGPSLTIQRNQRKTSR